MLVAGAGGGCLQDQEIDHDPFFFLMNMKKVGTAAATTASENRMLWVLYFAQWTTAWKYGPDKIMLCREILIIRKI